MYSLGGLAGAVAGGIAAGLGFNPLANFTTSSVVSLCIAVPAFAWLLPAGVDASGAGVSFSLPSRAVLTVGLIAFARWWARGRWPMVGRLPSLRGRRYRGRVGFRIRGFFSNDGHESFRRRPFERSVRPLRDSAMRRSCGRYRIPCRDSVSCALP